MFWYTCIFCMFLSITRANINCGNQTYVYKQPGNITIAALIGIHYGEGCSIVRSRGMQMVQSLITAIETVRYNNVIPGLNIGLTVYDTCSLEEMAQKAIVSTIVDADCSKSFLLGAVTEEETEIYIKNITKYEGLFTYVLTSAISETLLSSIVARVLYDLHWAPVNKLFSTNQKIKDEFLKATSSLNICVEHLSKDYEIAKLRPSDVAVIFSHHYNMTEEIVNAGRVLLVITDGEYKPLPEGKVFSSKVLLLLPTAIGRPSLLNPFNVSEKHNEEPISDMIISQVSIQQIQTMSDIMKLVELLKSHIRTHCKVEDEWNICTNMPRIHYNVNKNYPMSNLDSLKLNLKILGTEEDEFEAAVVIQPNGFQKLGSVKILENDWSFDVELNTTDDIKLCEKIYSHNRTGNDCSGCSNYYLLYTEYLDQRNLFAKIKLKQEAWVAALLTISSVGILCCIAIIVFITVRICKKDMLEGNPCFSFLLLFSIIFMYMSILPFSFKNISVHDSYEGIFCGLKIFGTSLSYVLVYSTMLARSIMLASCDEDGGFMSHINGYLQTILFFFITAVQIALSVQFWAINWFVLSEQQCIQMTSGSLFLFLLSYDMLLLFLLLVISPFTMRTKRNYHEGGYFGVSALLCTSVWLAWCAGYILLPEWEEVFICSGLVGTATVILVSVFIPRTYLMLTGIVRDHIVSTLPALAHTASTSVIDINYRSTQALYDSVTIPRGNQNPNYYSDRPTTPSTSKMEDDGIHDAYERYESTPPPHHITRF